MGKKKKDFQSKSKENHFYEKDFDLSKFKDEMKREMSLSIPKKNSITKESHLDNYESSYSNYITETFSSNIVMMINRICKESKTLTDDIRNQFPIHDLLIKLTKEFMFNQLELVYISIFLDYYDWKNKSFCMMDYLLVIGLAVKKYLNKDIDSIENYIYNEYPGINSKFNLWAIDKKELATKFTIIPRDVNKRFNQFTKPYNTYCKNNFIDYNESVDKILQMSLPYNEGQKQGGEKDKSEVASEIEQDQEEEQYHKKDIRIGDHEEYIIKHNNKMINEDKDNLNNDDHNEENNQDDNNDTINQISNVQNNSMDKQSNFHKEMESHDSYGKKQYEDLSLLELSNPLRNDISTVLYNNTNNLFKSIKQSSNKTIQDFPITELQQSKLLLNSKVKNAINKVNQAKKNKKKK